MGSCSSTNSAVVTSTHGEVDKKGDGRPMQQSTIGGTVTGFLFEFENELSKKYKEPVPLDVKVPDTYTKIEMTWDTDVINRAMLSKLVPFEDEKAKNHADEGKVKGNDVAWKANDGPYELPSGGGLEKVVEFIEELDPNSTKREIIAFGGTLFGNDAISHSEANIRHFMEDLMAKAEKEVHTVVLLGDILEMWMDSFQECAKERDQLVAAWSTPLCNYFVSCVHKLANDCGVKMFYVRGNHDHEISMSEVKSIFGDCLTFVGGTMIYRLQDQESEYRIRFSHGHEWDVYQSYVLDGKLMCGKPIGYYVSRAIATGDNGDGTKVVEKQLKEYTNLLLSGHTQIGSDILYALSLDDIRDRFGINMFAEAIGDPCPMFNLPCVVEEGKYITMDRLVDYPFLQILCEQVNAEHAFQMLKTSVGDYRYFVKQCCEDVVVLSHDVDAQLRKYKADNGSDIIFANTGMWTNDTEFSSVRINLPKSSGKKGSVRLDCKAQPEKPPKEETTDATPGAESGQNSEATPAAESSQNNTDNEII